MQKKMNDMVPWKLYKKEIGRQKKERRKKNDLIYEQQYTIACKLGEN